MRVYRSNRMEALSRQLADTLRRPPAGAEGDLAAMMTQDVVVVHSQGMARWLSMELARHLGVCANIAFPFPKAMVRQSVGAVVGEQEDAWRLWRPDAMLWAVLDALGEHLHLPAFAPLATYLAQRGGGEASLGQVDAVLLAREIADIFDRYISYRHDLIARWDQGEGEDWQPVLWRAVRARIAAPHLGAMVSDLEGALAAGAEVDLKRLPPRICLFGISTLPPFYLDLFGALSRIREVHLFILCPSNLYWGDIRGKREQARALRHLERTQGIPADLTELHLDEGNPLLASFGRLGRDFQVVLEGRDVETHYEEPEGDLFVDPAEGQPSLLHTLQSDILHVRDRGGPGGAPPIALAPEDTSVRVHACYGAMRQVEALRDDLLARFAADPTLEPRDVVVMTPDVERFAPLVEAVFGDEGAEPRLPCRIADRAVARENPIAEVLDRLLSMVNQRLTGHQLLDLFSIAPVQRRFGLHDDDMPTLKTWVRETGIRWGVDADHRQHHDMPEDHLNTWRFGLERMLLGVAMPGEGRHVFGGVLPYDEIEGGDAAVLGRLVDACEALFTSLESLTAPRTIDRWVESLKALLERMTAVADQDAWRVQQVHEALEELGEEAEGYDGPLDRASIHALVTRRLDAPRRAAGFLTGAVTFCAMVPMRSVPFRVVALLGLDEDSYPRKRSGLGFDLTWRHPRLGDRNPREEDRYLMLEALLAARDALVVTYGGHDPQTGATLDPATPIGELLEVVAGAAGLPEDLAPVVVHHPLHPFSPSLFGVDMVFDDDGLPERRAVPPRSFDGRQLAAARRMLGEPVAVPPLVRGPIALDHEEGAERTLSLATLIDFFKGPSKGFLYRRLGVYLEDSGDALEDREPTQIDAGLGEWSVRNAALTQALEGGDLEAVYERMRLSGALPLGRPGRVAFEEATVQVPAICDAHAAIASGDSEAVEVDLIFGDLRLVGQVDGLTATGRVVAHASTNKPKHTVGLWLAHLALRAMADRAATPSHLVGRAGPGAAVTSLGTAMSPLEARSHLEAIVGLYAAGQEAPLCFFPETSYAYAQALQGADPTPSAEAEKRARARALKAWKGDNMPWAECKDRYNVALHGDTEPVDAEGFAEAACAFWGPYLEEVTP